jgi:hypothetical protein
LFSDFNIARYFSGSRPPEADIIKFLYALYRQLPRAILLDLF